MPGITITGSVTRRANDSHGGTGHVAGNCTFTNLTCGKETKGGAAKYGYWVFDTPDLPHNAKITSASFWVQYGNAKAGNAFDQVFRTLKPGRWSKESVTGWTGIANWDARIIVYDSVPAAQITTTTVGQLNTFLRHRPPYNVVWGGGFERIGQTFLVTTDPSFVLSSIDWHLRKVGVPAGDLWLDLYQITFLEGGAETGNPGTLIATSDKVAVGSLVANPGADVNFNFPTTPTLNNSTAYEAVLVGDTPKGGGANYIGVNFSTGNPYNLGNCETYGTGYGFDRQNYPTDWSLWTIPRSSTRRKTPANAYGAAGATQEFTDAGGSDGEFKTIVQEAVNRAEYKDDHTIGLIWDPEPGVAGDLWYPAAYDNATYAPAELRITYEPRRVIIT